MILEMGECQLGFNKDGVHHTATHYVDYDQNGRVLYRRTQYAEWLEANASQPWVIDSMSVLFVSPDDALLFRMVFQ